MLNFKSNEQETIYSLNIKRKYKKKAEKKCISYKQQTSLPMVVKMSCS